MERIIVVAITGMPANEAEWTADFIGEVAKFISEEKRKAIVESIKSVIRNELDEYIRNYTSKNQ